MARHNSADSITHGPAITNNPPRVNSPIPSMNSSSLQTTNDILQTLNWNHKRNPPRQQIDLDGRGSGRLAIHLHGNGLGRMDGHVLALAIDNPLLLHMLPGGGGQR